MPTAFPRPGVVPMLRLLWAVAVCAAAGLGGVAEAREEKHAITSGEVAFTLGCTGQTAQSRPVVSSLNFSAIYVSPQPLKLGQNVDFRIRGTSTFAPGTSTADVLLKLSLSRQGGIKRHLVIPLCDMLGFNETSGCPIFNGSTFDMSSADGGTALPPPDEFIEGVYTVEMTPVSLSGKDLAQCISFTQVVMRSWTDIFPAIVAFFIASAASWHLGKAFPSIRLPLITGYLLVGVIVGPFMCNLVTRYHVFLLGQTINDFALSFISFAAGEEIFFPELRDILRSINLTMTAISAATLTFVASGFVVAAGSSFAEFGHEQDVSCRWSIGMLVAIIMVARSPATAVAVSQELGATGPSAKLCMGVTVMSDVVVLIGFALFSALASAMCPTAGVNGYVTQFDLTAVLLLICQFVAVAIVGTIVGFVLLFLLWIPIQRFRVGSFLVFRSHVKGALIIPMGYLVFRLLRFIGEASLRSWGRQFSIEPLMVCMIAASFAGHHSSADDRREKFANILAKSAPYVFLPFFTLTGASLQLDKVLLVLPLALVMCVLRISAIYTGISVGSCTCMRRLMTRRQSHWLWLTMISQAGVALGLAFEIRDRFPRWGDDFANLILAVVVLNQLVGPPLCKIGLVKLMKGDAKSVDPEHSLQAALLSHYDLHSPNIGPQDMTMPSPQAMQREPTQSVGGRSDLLRAQSSYETVEAVEDLAALRFSISTGSIDDDSSDLPVPGPGTTPQLGASAGPVHEATPSAPSALATDPASPINLPRVALPGPAGASPALSPAASSMLMSISQGRSVRLTSAGRRRIQKHASAWSVLAPPREERSVLIRPTPELARSLTALFEADVSVDEVAV